MLSVTWSLHHLPLGGAARSKENMQEWKQSLDCCSRTLRLHNSYHCDGWVSKMSTYVKQTRKPGWCPKRAGKAGGAKAKGWENRYWTLETLNHEPFPYFTFQDAKREAGSFFCWAMHGYRFFYFFILRQALTKSLSWPSLNLLILRP